MITQLATRANARRSARRTAAAIAACAMLSTAPLVAASLPAAADSGTVVSGIIETDTTWTTDNSPYLVYGPITIPADVTLTINPGVVVDQPYHYLTDGKGMFNVAGTLFANGTAIAPVEFDGGSQDWNTSLTKVDAANAQIELGYASIHDFTAVVGVNSRGGLYKLANSHVYRSGGTHVYDTKPGSIIARNFFDDAGGVRLQGSTQADVIDNRFRDTGVPGGWTSNQPFVDSSNAGGVPAQVHGNTFEPHVFTNGSSPRAAVSVAPDGALDATGNYWHTADVAVVKARIYDHGDNPTWPWTVPVDPLLSAPTGSTPLAAPQPVADMAAISATDKTITMSWTAPPSDGGSSVTGFQFSIPAVGFSTMLGAEARSFTASGLAPSTAYSVTITAFNALGSSRTQTWGAQTGGAAATPMPIPPPATTTPPAAPAAATAPDAPARPMAKFRRGKVVVTWVRPRTHGAPITGFQVTAKKRGSKAVKAKLAASKNSTVLKRLKPGKYRITVIALSFAGSSTTSPATTVKVPVH